jgi:selenocysteine lyase/cysteine desulfurase
MKEIQKSAFLSLENSVYSALETYANVHRGSGHFSRISTHLFEKAREICLSYLNLSGREYTVIFCSALGAKKLRTILSPTDYTCLCSGDFGLPIGIHAMVVLKKALPKGPPFYTGGGTARLISPKWVIWAGNPGKFEAGTPSVINIVTFARALQLAQRAGNPLLFKSDSGQLNLDQKESEQEFENETGKGLLEKLRKTIPGKNILLKTIEGDKPYINFDNSASTPAFLPVWLAARKTWEQPTSIHQKLINEVKISCAGFLGASSENFELIFTSNTTEAINIVAESLKMQPSDDTEHVLLNTMFEHSSNELPWRILSNYSQLRMDISNDGIVDLEKLESIFEAYNSKAVHGNKRISLFAMSGASNVLGIYNDLEKIGQITHRFGVHFLVDAAQLIAHREVNMERCNIDYLAFSAHKMYAPFGSGALVVRKGLLHYNQSSLEEIQSSGEENVVGIAALGKALNILQLLGWELIQKEEHELLTIALKRMKQLPGIRLFGLSDPDDPNIHMKGGIVLFEFKGIPPYKTSRELAMRRGIGVRYGCHCAHLIIKQLLGISPKIEILQKIIVSIFPKIQLQGIIRISFGLENTIVEVEEFVRVMQDLSKKQVNGVERMQMAKKIKTPAQSRAEAKNGLKEVTLAAAMRVFS